MQAHAVVMAEPGRLSVESIDLVAPGATDVVVAVAHSGISTGTEKLLWQGRMPSFPGMGYPLVPGYEAVGEIVEAGIQSGRAVGDRVFVPGAHCFGPVRSLFGAAAGTLVVPGERTHSNAVLGDERGVLLALAATAYHAVAGGALPDLIIGHGTVGRLIARITIALGGAPKLWENDPARWGGAQGYAVTTAEADPRRDYATICDCSGDAAIIDVLVGRLAKRGEIVLAGFYPGSVGFAFAPAFMREARLRIAAEWAPDDMAAVLSLIECGALSLDGLVTHRAPAHDAASAYPRAFTDPACLKMVLDWRDS
jgi:3-hydroxyethyl bacteriochlorophyllide a dehydrogenase